MTAPVRDVRLEQLARCDWAAAAEDEWSRAERLWPHMSERTNHVRAAREFAWDGLLEGAGRTVLDLGCGPGWLAGMLSLHPAVGKVLAWDSSPYLLSEVLPRMVELAGGDPRRIERVCGDFLPLLVDDASLDLVVMSSAFHHAPDPDAVLAEVRRVLIAGSALVLLNETPWHPLGLLGFASRHYLATVLGLAGLSGPRVAGAVIRDGGLHDPVLGDRAYTMRGWRRIARRNGWSLEARASGLPPYPEHARPRGRLEPELHHFVLRAGARR